MNKKGYYEYIPQIYTRKLWVMYNTSEEEIDKCFTDMKGKPIVHNDEPMTGSETLLKQIVMFKINSV